MKSDRGRTGREIALNVGAIAGLICVLAAAASFFFGIKPLIFRSGSMSPEITTGSLALSHNVPASDLAVGDVVSVLNEQGTRITHRVKEIVSSNGDTSVLILKGDANKDADISPYTVAEADRVFFSLPGLGYAVAWLSSPLAIFLGGAFVGGLMVVAFRPASGRRDDDEDSGTGGGTPGAHEEIEQPVTHAHSEFEAPTEQFHTPRFSLRSRMPARTLMAAGALGLTALVGMTAGTSAAFTDTAGAASSFASRSTLVPAPQYLGCSTWGGNSGQTLSWKHLGPGYTYQVQLINAYSSTVAPSIPANKGDTVTLNISTYNNIYKTAATSYVEVRTIRNGVTGTSWIGERIYSSTIWSAWCNGAHTGGGDQTSFAAPSGGGTDTMAARMAAPAPSTTAPSTTTATSTTATSTTATSTSAAPTTTSTTTPSTSAAAATTTTTAPTTTTAAAPTATTAPTTTPAEKSTTTAESTTTTPAPATTTEEVAAAPEAPSGELAMGNASASGKYAAAVSGTSATITDKSGAQVFSTTVGKKAVVQWAADSDQLWIVDGSKLSVVDAATGSQKDVDPSSAAVPAEVAALVAK
ncbi:signal peptidase I [Rhodococcus maanshanensis]|uniref:Signal peptidase I n=1 Tax=Rhodococcus maanshanensis TaxID=183556 RepID=A0A1H7TB96_9NOCA|nr:signal peptidase I [Rhodococcus maanshanensis]SEL81958.1 signal peptidase I [Rhodococcus maanshanensis]